MKRTDTDAETVPRTLAAAIADELAAAGVRRMFGVPGGGSSLDLIDAAAARGIEFVLSQTETAGAIMAAVTGELTGSPGVVLTGVGPGAASVVNGAAYAALERAPLVVFTDQVEGTAGGGIHQKYDQPALFRPLVKDAAVLSASDGAARFADLLRTSLRPPYGPVHVDLSAAQASAAAGPTARRPDRTDGTGRTRIPADLEERFRGARRPVLLVGLEARDPAVAEAVATFLSRISCPVLTTYKAKGVVADTHPCLVGHVTGGTAEAPVLHGADLILTVGLDPVELVNQPWPYEAPVIALSHAPHEAAPFAPAGSIAGEIPALLEAAAARLSGADWPPADIEGLKTAARRKFLTAGVSRALGRDDPRLLVPALKAAAGSDVRLTVDSGAHMFPAMALWEARRPFDVLKSNGLSTMGFALPAAIASAMAEPDRPVVALTGDGGLSMCLTELATAARLDLPVVTVVFNDAALSLIDIKQQAQQRPSLGVRYPRIDYAAAARAMGVPGRSVQGVEALSAAVEEGLARPGPGLIDVTVDPDGYPDMLAALRK